MVQSFADVYFHFFVEIFRACFEQGILVVYRQSVENQDTHSKYLSFSFDWCCVLVLDLYEKTELKAFSRSILGDL